MLRSVNTSEGAFAQKGLACRRVKDVGRLCRWRIGLVRVYGGGIARGDVEMDEI